MAKQKSHPPMEATLEYFITQFLITGCESKDLQALHLVATMGLSFNVHFQMLLELGGFLL